MVSAEVTEVANSVLDGAECVMLSGETAKGKYPIETVTLMSKICKQAESVMHNDQHRQDIMATLPSILSTSESIALAAVVAAAHHHCSAMLTLTKLVFI